MGAPNTTPGPWVVNPYRAQVDCGVLDDDGDLLPVTRLLWPTTVRSESETDANAHQIAASPALYDAAVDALAGWRYIRQVHGDLYGVAWDRVEVALTAALASACGEQP